jgi:hypothetical protein
MCSELKGPSVPALVMTERGWGTDMTKYIKKPVAIEAVKYEAWMQSEDDLPIGVVIQFWPESKHGPGDYPTINTLEGPHMVDDGDYVITGVKGERYPCKPNIFKMTYYTEQEYAELGL